MARKEDVKGLLEFLEKYPMQSVRFFTANVTDYITVHCARCGGPVEVVYKGRDPTMHLFEFTCTICGEGGAYKMRDDDFTNEPELDSLEENP